MLAALCRTYRASAAFGFRNWGGTSKQYTGTFAQFCTSTEGEGEGDGSGEPSESDEGQMTLDDVEWDDVITLWANAHACYIEKDRSILAESKRACSFPPRHMHTFQPPCQMEKADRDSTLKLYAPDGTIESAYDDTSRPIYDSRVWLHMYEGPGGALLPSFCKRTGAAQYMYDFTGFTEWRVEQNALLSDEAKCLMYKLWAPQRGEGAWTDTMLAHAFKIRVQRALAIVKIKELEFKAAEQNVENLNKLQTILGMEARPDLKELRKPANLHTKKHLTAWFDEWVQLYELLPLIIHPDSTKAESADSAESSDPSDASDSAGTEGEHSGAAEAADAAAEAVEAEEETKSDSEGGKKKKKGGKKAPEGDGRVMLTREQVDEVVTLHNALTKAANAEAKQIACHEDLWRTVYHHGTGEKYIPFLQTMPAFEERPVDEAEDAVNAYDIAVEETTRAMDKEEIQEFRRNLSWALQETGKTIQRAPRKRGARGATLPRKPDGGWPILVTPLHAGGKRGKPFVAMPDTTRRDLTDDEELYLNHFKVEPRVFSRPRRHAPYTNDTLHMFTQRKPNPHHDLYNPPYEGSPKQRAPKSGPDRKQQRRERMAAMRKRKDLAPLLAGTRM